MDDRRLSVEREMLRALSLGEMEERSSLVERTVLSPMERDLASKSLLLLGLRRWVTRACSGSASECT